MSRSVYASMRFLGACDGKPAAYGRQREKDNLPFVEQRVPIEDACASDEAFDLDVQGFQAVRHVSATRDFADRDERRRVWLPELEQLVQTLSGAEKTLALDSSVLRRNERSRRYLEPGSTVPGRFVHCDYSRGPMGSMYWLDRVLPEEEAQWRRHRRFAIYNVWRVLSPPPYDTPLALCDVRTLRAEDRVAADCVCDTEDMPEWRFENSLYRYHHDQRWFYFSHLDADTSLVFKGYDSNAALTDGVPHSAFDCPDCPADAPARESVDERVIAFF